MWLVELSSLRGDVEAVADVLIRTGYELRKLEGESVSHLLYHPKYEKFDSAADVWEDAKRVAATLRRFSELDQSIDLRIDLGSVRSVRPDGTFTRNHFQEMTLTAHASISGEETLTPNSEISAEERERRIQKGRAEEIAGRRNAAINRASWALVQPIVLQVLELLKSSEPAGTELGHIVDLVRDACNGDLTRFTTKSDLERFERSINHPQVLGLQARHAVSHVNPPPRPMTIIEARAFARALANSWLTELGKGA